LVGQATLVDLVGDASKLLIVAPTMRVPRPIVDYVDVYLSTRAAIRCAKAYSLDSVVIPGMGTSTGNVPYQSAARNMLIGIRDALEGVPEYKTCAEAYLDNTKFNF
jgi:O-acetyl-ADP-ribose deacetylase (regulator of RNase III)